MLLIKCVPSYANLVEGLGTIGMSHYIANISIAVAKMPVFGAAPWRM